MIRVYDNFLSNDECDSYIDLINNNKQIYPFTIAGHFSSNKFFDEPLSKHFFSKLKSKAVNDKIDDDFVAPNSIIMTGKYNPGGNFGLHTDTGLFYDKSRQTKSKYTLLIYLNDNFQGGETTFFTNDFQEECTIIPKKGSCLIFDMIKWHKGNEVLNGVKYWIGCEIIGKMS